MRVELDGPLNLLLCQRCAFKVDPAKFLDNMNKRLAASKQPAASVYVASLFCLRVTYRDSYLIEFLFIVSETRRMV